MSKPVLSPITSINALVKGQPWIYQPAVKSGGPATAWTAVGLPPGITLTTGTGKLSGVPTTPGVYNVTLKAKDAANVFSDPLIFPIGVESLPEAQAGDGAVRWNVNLQTGEVYCPDHNKAPFVKAGDKMLVSIGYEDGGVLQEIPMMGLITVAMKVWDDEEWIDISDGNFIKVGDFETTRYLVELDLDSDQRIRDAFDEFEDPHGTGYVALAEIEWIWFAWRPGVDEPVEHRRTTDNYPLTTMRDLDPTRRFVTI